MARRCVVLHPLVAPDAPADDADVLAEAASVATALSTLGWSSEKLAIALDLGAAAKRLRADRPDLVFNLVDSLGGFGPLCAAVPALLSALGLPFTGGGSASLALTSDKPATRHALRRAGLPIPPGPEDGWPGPYIVKHATEHASRGLGKRSVVPTLPLLEPGWYAEAFLDGAEYNVSLLADGRGSCAALPVAELVYAGDWPADMPRILDYAGKWDRAHLLYARTTRRFAESPNGVRELARDAWQALGLEGYARIDLRLGADGVPRVIDVNANPCLAEDAGFAAAAAAAGMEYATLIGRIAAHSSSPPPRRLPIPLPLREGIGGGVLRWHLIPADQAAIGGLCRDTGFFSEAEIAIAEELAADRLTRGNASDYRFVVADGPNGAMLAYACYGPVPATRSAWDLYWIVVDPAVQGSGLGRRVLDAVLAEAGSAGASQLYAETEATLLYAPTRAFYAACGFHLQAVLPDYFAPGAGKQIWVRPLARDPAILRG